MKNFLFKIVVFSIVLFVAEKFFYVFLYVSPTLEKDIRLEKVINGEINKEIIVLGSSRGARNIIAGQIEDSLKLSSYNLSYPGSDIEFHEFLLRSLLKFNKKPKIVLLAVDDPAELLPNETINFRLDRLYPLAKYNYINNEMIKRGEKDFLSYFFVLARINRMNFYIKEKYFSNLDTIKNCGSMPISFQAQNRKFNYKRVLQNYSIKDELPNKIESFLEFQRLCISNKIKLILVFSPNFKNQNISFEKRLKQLSKPDVSLFVYDTLNYVYKDRSYFYDEFHLQNKGAIIFTNEIIEELKNQFKHE